MSFDCNSCIKANVCKHKSGSSCIKKDILEIPWGNGYTYNERNGEPFEITIGCNEFMKEVKTFRSKQ